MNKSTATLEAEAAIKARKPKSNWIANLSVWVIDVISALIVIALAVQGARSLIADNLSGEVKLGIAALIVGLFAARLIERLFQNRR